MARTKPRALDGDEAERAPPDRAAGAVAPFRQAGHGSPGSGSAAEDAAESRRAACGSRSCLVLRRALRPEPDGQRDGERRRAVDHRPGREDRADEQPRRRQRGNQRPDRGLGRGSRASGFASLTLVTTSSRISVRRPLATGSASRSCPERLGMRHHRDAGEVVGRRRRGGRPFERAGAPGIVAGAAPRRAGCATTFHETAARSSAKNSTAPNGDEQVERSPARAPPGRCRPGAACPAARAGASGRRPG